MVILLDFMQLKHYSDIIEEPFPDQLLTNITSPELCKTMTDCEQVWFGI